MVTERMRNRGLYCDIGYPAGPAANGGDAGGQLGRRGTAVEEGQQHADVPVVEDAESLGLVLGCLEQLRVAPPILHLGSPVHPVAIHLPPPESPSV
jgi:hypothetical protein